MYWYGMSYPRCVLSTHAQSRTTLAHAIGTGINKREGGIGPMLGSSCWAVDPWVDLYMSLDVLHGYTKVV